MHIAVRYHSRSGNTGKLAEAIGRAAGTEVMDVSVDLTEKTDILFLGSAVYGGDVDEAVRRFLKDNREKIGILYNFSTAAVAGSTYKQISRIAEEYGIPMAKEEFHCRGNFLFLHKGHPNGEDLRKAEEFTKKVLLR